MNKKYKIFNLFKNKVYIDKLKPLRLEENVKYIRDSPISIVAEVLLYYETKKIGKQNIKLNDEIKIDVEHYEEIINKYFQSENQNYYHIKILSTQFKKFTKSTFLNFDISGYPDESKSFNVLFNLFILINKSKKSFVNFSLSYLLSILVLVLDNKILFLNSYNSFSSNIINSFLLFLYFMLKVIYFIFLFCSIFIEELLSKLTLFE